MAFSQYLNIREKSGSSLTDLKFDGVYSTIFEPHAFVMFFATMTSGINKKFFFVSAFDTSGRVCLEISVVFEQNGTTLNMYVFPLALYPFRQLTRLGQM